MKWTNTKPTTTGFYWIRSLMESPQLVQIGISEQGQLKIAFILDDSQYSVTGLHEGYEFFGPINVPQ